MKQIRTVIKPISEATRFDMTINRLLNDGWELINRKIIDSPGDISEAFNFPVITLLYAELIKESADRFEEITL